MTLLENRLCVSVSHLCQNCSVRLSTGDETSFLRVQTMNKSWSVSVYRKDNSSMPYVIDVFVMVLLLVQYLWCPPGPAVHRCYCPS